MQFYKHVFNTPGLCWAYQAAAGLKLKVKSWLRPPRPLATAMAPAGPELIYAPQGSMMIFHRDFFARGGRLNYQVFLFGEEIFIAEQARALNLAVWYRPELVARHWEHIETGLFPSRRMRGWIAEASRHLADTYWA
jgi:hypothetical protein